MRWKRVCVHVLPYRKKNKQHITHARGRTSGNSLFEGGSVATPSRATHWQQQVFCQLGGRMTRPHHLSEQTQDVVTALRVQVDALAAELDIKTTGGWAPKLPEDLEDMLWASFLHAQAHDDDGSDFELCDGDCSRWPDAHDPNEDQPYDPSGEFYDPDA